MSRVCYRCGRDIGAVERIGRRDRCLGCDSDLHCCRNCAFYEPSRHNECREAQAERQVDKERGNFCDYFRCADHPQRAAATGGDARARLEKLFATRGRDAGARAHAPATGKKRS